MKRDDDNRPAAISPAMFHVMVAIADGDRHGYAIMKEVASRTNGSVQLTASTLYGIVKRLLADGLIAETTARAAPAGDDPRRRYYRLTPLGRRLARAEADRMARALKIARATLSEG
jgi:DNA-binding PadR family transcriptional regulator